MALFAYFRWSAVLLQRKMQGFLAHLPENLAPEQSQLAFFGTHYYNTLEFKAFGFVQYALLYTAVQEGHDLGTSAVAGGGKQTAADAAATLLIPFSLAQATAFA